jgi:hypothetical protein
MLESLPPQLIQLARSQQGALTGTQLRATCGDRKVSRLLTGGVIVLLWRNAYAVPSVWASPAVITNLKAAQLTLGRPVTACLHTAAQLHGFDISGDRRTHVLATNEWSGALRGLVQHRYVPLGPIGPVSGYLATGAAETAIRVACRQSDPAKALAVLDAASATAVGPTELAEVAASLHIRGIRLVRELVPFADGRAESPGESWLRWVCIEAALPSPTPQLWVTTAPGRHYRLDLGWPESRAGCEYDGVEFHTGAALTKDRARYNALARAGWQTHGVTSTMIWRDRHKLVADLRAMLA